MDNFKLKPLYLFPIILVIGLSFISSGCNPNDNENSVNNFEELIMDIYNNENFTFSNLSWFITREEVIEARNLDEELALSEKGDYLIENGKTFAIGNESLEQTIVYIFTDDKSDSQFVSGEYLFTTQDKELFVEFSSRLKTYLQDELPEPYANDLEVLDQANNVSDSATSIMWEGIDGSRLTVSISILQGEIQNEEFLLTIKSTAPHDK